MLEKFRLPVGTAVGLDVGMKAIRVVVLKRVLNKFHVVAYSREKISSSNPNQTERSQAIRQLFHRLKISSKEVIAHLEGVGVRYAFVDAPLLFSDELPDWIRQYLSKRWPSALSPDRIIHSWHILQHDENSIKLMIAYCQPQVLHECIQLFADAGLQPIIISAGRLDAVHTFLFTEDNTLSKSVFYVDIDQTRVSFSLAQGGRVIDYCEDLISQNKDNQTYDWNAIKNQMLDLLSQWQQNGHPAIERVAFIGDEAESACQQNILPNEEKVDTGKPLLGLLKDRQHLPPEYGLAAGLALRKFFPLLNTVNFLPEERRLEIDQQQEKKIVIAFILGIGALILLSLIGLNVLNTFLQARLEDSELQVLQYTSEIRQLENLQQAHTNLRNTFFEVQRLTMQRSQHASILYDIGNMIPDGMWLQALHIGHDDQDDPDYKNDHLTQLKVHGWSTTEDQVAALLERLEQSSLLSDVRLIKTLHLPEQEVWRRSRMRKTPLIEFVVRCHVLERKNGGKG